MKRTRMEEKEDKEKNEVRIKQRGRKRKEREKRGEEGTWEADEILHISWQLQHSPALEA